MILLTMSVAGCKPDPTDKQVPEHTAAPQPTAHTGPVDTGTRPGPELLVTQAQHGSLSVEWTLPMVEVRAASPNVLFTWSGLTIDAWGDPIVASDVPRLLLFEILVPPAEVGERLAKDDLGYDLLSVWEAEVTGRVFADADELASGASTFDPAAFFLENPDRSWVAAVADVDGAAYRIRSAAIVVPKAASGGSSVAIADGGASISWSAALDGAPLVTADEWEAWTADWDDLSEDLLGKPFDDRVVDELFVARYVSAPGALGGSFRDLPGAADAVWRLGVGGFHDAALELARDESGGTFPGFTAGDTWVLGTRCTTCLSPFPSFAAVVEVR